MSDNDNNPFNGDPIKVVISGPKDNTVPSGHVFTYIVKVLDSDQASLFNRLGIDPSVAIFPEIASMSRWGFRNSNNVDSAGNLVCVLQGVAREPGEYVDAFTGYNMIHGLTWDAPTTEVNTITVT